MSKKKNAALQQHWESPPIETNSSRSAPPMIQSIQLSLRRHCCVSTLGGSSLRRRPRPVIRSFNEYSFAFQQTQQQPFRLFSASVTPSVPPPLPPPNKNPSSSSSSSSAVDHDPPPPEALPLYQRGDDRTMIPRAVWGVSIFNTTYWLWYLFDFIPTVNASPVFQDMHVDARIGWVALAIGMLMNGVTSIYTSLLVSRLDYDPSSRELLVYRHTFPFLSPSTKSTNYTLGEISISPTDAKLKKILRELRGDLQHYKGHLALQRKNHSMPLLLEIHNGQEEVKNGVALLQGMLSPKALILSTMASSKERRREGGKRNYR